MNFTEALSIIGGLSSPSKMPWYSWSISAEDCITGSRLRNVPGSVCSTCYALKGRYLFPNVRQAHMRRRTAAEHPLFVDAFVVVLEQLRKRQRKEENRFRWFDSGDIQSLEMLEAINQIALRTPQVRHWLPTRETGIVRLFLAKHGSFARNLIIRISCSTIGTIPRHRPVDLPMSTVGVVEDTRNWWQCPARETQGNECRTCDGCWRDNDVNYPLH